MHALLKLSPDQPGLLTFQVLYLGLVSLLPFIALFSYKLVEFLSLEPCHSLVSVSHGWSAQPYSSSRTDEFLHRWAAWHGMACRRALELKPSSPSYALNLMHGLELQQAYGKALQLALDFCTATRYGKPSCCWPHTPSTTQVPMCSDLSKAWQLCT